MEILGGNAASGGANVIDATDQTFMADVIEPSNDVPVLVDFWAPWCGPCKSLGPIIEKVVESLNGKVRLVKVNIDENPGVAGQLGVRSIPAVFAFDKGRPVDGFMGALPEGQIRSFIDKILSGTDDGKQVEQMLEEAQKLFQANQIGEAAQIYASIVQNDPSNVSAIAGLARCYLANNDSERAKQVLDMIPEDQRSHPDVKGVLTALELLSNAAPTEELDQLAQKLRDNPDDFDAHFEMAEQLAGHNRHDEAVEHLFAILSSDLEWNDGAAKQQLFKIFEAAGPKAEVTVKGRRRLSAMVFS